MQASYPKPARAQFIGINEIGNIKGIYGFIHELDVRARTEVGWASEMKAKSLVV